MKRLVTARAFGSAVALEALMQRLDGAPVHAGWRRETFGLPPLGRTPNALVFEAPPGRFAELLQVSLWRDAKRGEVELTTVHVDGLSPERPEYPALHDAAVLDFARDVLGPATEATGAGLCMTPTDVRIDDLVAPVVADRLHAFAGSDVRDARIHEQDEARFLRLVAVLHATHTDLDGDTFDQWLREDVGWPGALAGRLGRELDRGRALLRAYDGLRAGMARAQKQTEEGP